MSLETLLGLTNDPAYLDRYGPIPASLARDLAGKGTFRCAATDDTHATILGLGHATYTPSYRPGQRLHDLTRATWRHCSFPGCRNRALKTGQCELDHATAWPAGPTCNCNINPVCKRHHQMKTHGHITLEPSSDPTDPPGTLHWRLPTGRTYPSRPDPMILDRRLVEPHQPPRQTTKTYTDPDEPPPF